MSKSFGNMFHEMCNCSKTNECLTVMIVCSGSLRNCLRDMQFFLTHLEIVPLPMKYVESKWENVKNRMQKGVYLLRKIKQTKLPSSRLKSHHFLPLHSKKN